MKTIKLVLVALSFCIPYLIFPCGVLAVQELKSPELATVRNSVVFIFDDSQNPALLQIIP